MDLTTALKEAGLDVVVGKDAVLRAMEESSDGSNELLCSGYRVFPSGQKCQGCKDCTTEVFK